MINKLKSLFHIHHYQPLNRSPNWKPHKESQYWKIEQCECGKEREVL